MFIRSMTLALATMAFLLAASSTTQADGWRPYKDRPLRVVTQNLYVGGDIFLPISVPPEFFEEAAAEVVNQILTTNYPERAMKLSHLIKREWPQLIGLQEVYIVRICLDEQQTVCPVDQDYLEILLDNLNYGWNAYRVASSVTNTQIVNLPATLPGDIPVFVTIIDRDVVLAHRFVPTRNAVGVNYQAALPVENEVFDGGLLLVLRGYAMVDAVVWGNKYRFVNTHLEITGTGSPLEPVFRTVQALQALELTGMLQTVDRTQIVVGDFNSDPFDGPFVPCLLPGGACPTPYAVMTSEAYTDVWFERPGPFELGNTCCQQALLDNAVSQLDERIDQVWAKRAPALSGDTFLRFVRVDLIGEDAADKTISGLWPSDHAGVSAKMLVRTPR